MINVVSQGRAIVVIDIVVVAMRRRRRIDMREGGRKR